MPTDYDKISVDFEKSIQLDFRKYVEMPSFFKLAPNLKGKKVLDLACGDGRYTRAIKKRGASHVVGVDQSEAMLALARKEEKENPLGIEYICQDVERLGTINDDGFNVVAAVYLLHYADNPELLKAFCQAIFSNLRTGGNFIAINANLHTPVEYYGTYRKYKHYISTDVPRKEGMPRTVILKNNDGTFVSIDSYYLSPETYEDVFKNVGFTDFKWEALGVSPEGETAMGKGFWDHFIEHPFHTAILAKKP